MQLNIVAVVMIVGGFILLYGAIKNLNPLNVVQNALSNKPLSSAKPIN